MLKLDNNLLEELGLGSLPEDQKRQMLQHIYETLELRVGTQLANQMTDKQLEEFERFIDAGGDANQAQALQWLESNLPNYKQVVQETFDALKTEVKQMAPQLLAAAAQQPTMAASTQPPVDPMNAYQTPPQQYQAGVPVQQPVVQPQPYAQPVQQPQPQQYAQQQQWAQPPQQSQPQPQPLNPPTPQPSFTQPQPIPQPTQPQQWAQPQPSPAPAMVPEPASITQPVQQSDTQQWQPQPLPQQPSQPAPDPLTWQPPQPPQTPPQPPSPAQ